MEEQTLIKIARFEVPEGVNEYHVMIRMTDPRLTYTEQVEAVLTAYARLVEGELKGSCAVFKRFFLSDAANQADYLLAMHAEDSDCPLSIVEQPPLDGSKVAMWVYLQKGVRTKALSKGIYEMKHGAYRHLWMAGASNQASNSEYHKNPDLNAQLVAENIASQLERRIAFRRAMKQCIGRTMKLGAKGIKISASGRLAGAEIARTEHYHEGTIPLQTIRADIDYGFAEANTTYGKIGIKVWIYRGEVLNASVRREARQEAPRRRERPSREGGKR